MTEHERSIPDAAEDQASASAGGRADPAGERPTDAVAPGPDAVTTSPPGHARRRPRPGGIMWDVLVVVVGALLVSTLVRSFVAQVFEIPSTSMTNTLLRHDRVVVSRVSDVHRGDIVVFKDPGGWLEDEHGSTRHGAGRALEALGVLPNTASDHLIKRLVGMPGDHVACCDAHGQVTVNGQPLDERSYLWTDPVSGRQDAPARQPFDVVVPADHVWVMGDHRSGSRDSRCHLQDVTPAGGPSGTNAFVPMDDVVGPAVAIVAPLDRLRHLVRPHAFAAVPDASRAAPASAVITAGTTC